MPVPQNPVPNFNERQLMKRYLEGVEKEQFGETGPQREGTKTIPT